MSDSKYISCNGTFVNEDALIISHRNYAFRYGEVIWENMHASGRTVQFFDDHFSKIIGQLNFLKFGRPASFVQSTLHDEISRLLNKNKLYQGAKIRLTISREENEKKKGLLDTHYYIETEKLDCDNYQINTKGYKVDVLEELRKPSTTLSMFKSYNSLLYFQADRFRVENKLDDCIILNDHDHVVETIASNILVIKDTNVFTPPFKDGCSPDVMRKQTLKIAKDLRLNVKIDQHIKVEDLENADEILLVNAVQGIRWVLAYKQRRYFNQVAKLLIAKLNEIAFAEREYSIVNQFNI